jgi:exosome complex exonuclease DIS3/RRP44
LDTYVKQREEESPNDRNDKAIRVAAAWLVTQLNKSLSSRTHMTDDDDDDTPVVVRLLSDDFMNRQLAKEMEEINNGLAVSTTKEFVLLLKDKFPELIDLVANFESNGNNKASNAGSGGGGASGGGGKSSHQMSRQTRDTSAHYLNHYSEDEIKAGLISGQFYQGTLRCARGKWDDCYTVVALKRKSNSNKNDGVDERESVFIKGDQNVNRAMEGDIIAIELIQQDDSSTMVDDDLEEEEKAEGEESEMRANISEPTAAPQPGELEQVSARSSRSNNNNGSGGGGEAGRPHGRVVGIIRRNWKQYCG